MNVVGSILRRYLERFVNTYLQKDDQDIRVDVSQGEVNLRKIKLKREFVNDMLVELPVQLRDSYIDVVTLTVPWHNIFNQAVEARLKNIRLELELKDPAAVVFAPAHFLAQALKAFRQAVERKVRPAEDNSRGFIQGTVQRIVDNLQVSVEDIELVVHCPHLITRPEFRFALAGFDFHTTNAAFTAKAFVDRDEPGSKDLPIYKKLSLSALSLSVFVRDEVFQAEHSSAQRRVVVGRRPVFGQVFSFSLTVFIRIKTRLDDCSEPQNQLSLQVDSCELTLREDQLESIFMLLGENDKFREKLFVFRRLELLKPRVRLAEAVGQVGEHAELIRRRWWLYAFFAVSLQNREKRRESIFSLSAQQSPHARARGLSKAMQAALRGAVERHLAAFLRNNYSFPAFHDDGELIEPAWLLSLLSTEQLDALIDAHCKDVLQKEIEFNKNRSLLNKFMRMLGITQFSSDDEQIRHALRANFTGEETRFSFIALIDAKIDGLVFNFATSAQTRFRAALSGFHLRLELFKDRLAGALRFSDLSFHLLREGLAREAVVSRGPGGAEALLQLKFEANSEGEALRSLVKAKLGALQLDLRPAVVDEVVKLLSSLSRVHREASVAGQIEGTIRQDIARRVRNVKGEFCLLAELQPMRAVLELHSKSRLELGSGALKLSLTSRNVAEESSELALQCEQLRLDYLLGGRRTTLCELALHARVQQRGLNRLSRAFAVELFCADLTLNLHFHLLAKLLQDARELHALAADKARLIVPLPLKKLLLPVARDKRLPLARWELGLFTVNANMTVSVWTESAGVLLHDEIVRLSPVYIARRDCHLLKLERAGQRVYLCFTGAEELRRLIDFLLAREVRLLGAAPESLAKTHDSVVVEGFLRRCSLNVFDDLGHNFARLSAHDLFGAYRSQPGSAQLNLRDLVLEDFSLFNLSPNKLVAHLGAADARDERFFSPPGDAGAAGRFPPPFTAAFFDAEAAPAEAARPAFFDADFDIRGCSVLLDLSDARRAGVEARVERLLFFWNAAFLQHGLAFFARNLEQLAAVNRHFARERPPAAPAAAPALEVTLRLAVDRVVFFNFNDAAFRLEAVGNGLDALYVTTGKEVRITASLASFSASDLTGYPFTQKLHELREYPLLARHCFLRGGAPAARRAGAAEEPAFVCEVVSAAETRAEAVVRHAQFRYYHQLTLRIVDFLVSSLLPLLFPEAPPPVDAAALRRLIEGVSPPRYSLQLLDCEISLRPHPAIDRDIRVACPRIRVANEILRGNCGRDLARPERSFLVERVSVVIDEMRVGGYARERQMLGVRGFSAVVERMLSVALYARLFGAEDFLARTHHGLDVRLAAESVEGGLFRNDYVLLMATLFNNIAYDDLQSREFACAPLAAESTPLRLEAFLAAVSLNFNYESPSRGAQSFAIFALAALFVEAEVLRSGATTLRLAADELTGHGLAERGTVRMTAFIEQARGDAQLGDLAGELLLCGERGSRSSSLGQRRAIAMPAKDLALALRPSRAGWQPVAEARRDAPLTLLLTLSPRGDKDVRVALRGQKLTLLPPLFRALAELVGLADEMYFNGNVQPPGAAARADLRFELLLEDSFAEVPHDRAKFPLALFAHLGRLRFAYESVGRADEGVARLQPFAGWEDLPRETPDQELASLQAAFEKHRFDCLETLLECEARGVEVFAVSGNRFQAFRGAAAQPRSDAAQPPLHVRHLLRHARLRFSSAWITNDTFKNVALYRAEAAAGRLSLALCGYDLAYLLSCGEFAAAFGFEAAPTADDAQRMLAAAAEALRASPRLARPRPSERRLTRVEACELRLSLLDDVFFSGRPLLQARLTSTPAALYRTHEFEGVAGLRLSAECRYFNHRIEAWEPVCENLALAAVSRARLEEAQTLTELIVDSELTAVNVSTELVDLAQLLAADFAQSRRAAQLQSFLCETELVLRSRVAFPLRLALHFADEHQLRVELAPGAEERVFARKKRNRRKNVALRRVQLWAMDAAGAQELGALEGALPAAARLRVALPGQPPFDLHLRCARERNQRTLELYTLFSVRNGTDLALKLKFLHRGQHRSLALRPGDEAETPPQFLDGGFALKPLLGAERQPYSEAALFAAPPPGLRTGGGHHFALECERSHRVCVVVLPALRVCNHLLRAFTLQLEAAEETREVSVAHPAPTTALYAHPASAVTRLGFDGLLSAPLRLAAGRSLLPLFDAQGRQVMSVAAEVGGARLVFFHPALIANELGGEHNFSQVLARREVQSHVIAASRAEGRDLRYLCPEEELRYVDRGWAARVDVPLRAGQRFFDIVARGAVVDQISVSVEQVMLDAALGIRQTVATFRPKHLLVNRSELALALRPREAPGEETPLPANSRRRLRARGGPDAFRFQLRHAESFWSEAVDLSRTGFYEFSLRRRDGARLDHLGLEVNELDSCFQVTVHRSEGVYLVENALEGVSVLLFQAEECLAALDCDLEVPPRSAAGYSWRYALRPPALHLLFLDAATRAPLAGDWQPRPGEPRRQALRLELDRDAFAREIGLGRRGVLVELKVTRQRACLSFAPIDRPRGAEERPSTHVLRLRVAGLGFSLIYGKGRARRELAFVHAESVDARYTRAVAEQALELSVAALQVDYNANLAARFPILLSPHAEGRRLDAPPLVSLRVALSRLDAKGLTIFSLVEARLQPLRICVEEDLVRHVLRLARELGRDDAERATFLARKFRDAVETPAPQRPERRGELLADARPTYFRRFLLSDVELHLSFAKSLVRENADDFAVGALLSALKALANLDGLRVVLPAIALANESNTLAIIAARLVAHYKSRLLPLAVKLLGSVDLIGNPAKFAQELRAGLRDFVDLPDREGLEGVVGGTTSLIKHTVAGSFGVINRIARTLGDGTSYLAADHDYALLRNQMLLGEQHRARKILVGLRQGRLGVVEGVRGALAQPLAGCRLGPRDALKGVYRGLSGLLFKPLTGLLDLTSATAEGLREVFLPLRAARQRRRLPRPFYSNKAFYSRYNPTDATTFGVVLTHNGYQILLVEEVNFGLEKIVVCVEGVLLVDEKGVSWRKNIEFVFGCVPAATTCSVEYFDLAGETISYGSKLVELRSRASGEKIAAAVHRVVQVYSQMVREGGGAAPLPADK